MNKDNIKINMVGGGFQHDICSTALNKNKHIEWDKDQHLSNISFHIDDAVCNIPVDSSKINFGWFNESSAIIPNYINMVLHNHQHYKQIFKNIFTYDKRLLDKDPDFFKYVQPPANSWIQNKKIYNKTKLISFIASNKVMCSGHQYRQQIIKKYQHLVDHYGRGFGERELPWTIQAGSSLESGKILGLKDYMYSIVMENSVYDDYFCEKLTDCFATGTIPIYWGSRSIKKYFDIEGIIFLEDLTNFDCLTEDLYKSKMKHIKNNLKILKKMSTSEDFIYLNYLKGKFVK